MTRRHAYREQFVTLKLYGGADKIVRAYYHDDLAAFIVHGPINVPFGDVAKSARKWNVAHEKTSRLVSGHLARRLTFSEAIMLAKMMDDACPMWSQVANQNGEYRPETRALGYEGEPHKAMIETILAFSDQKKIPIIGGRERAERQLLRYSQ